jgi:Na+-translocating ferredoxin:NAD+ oxidoreductase RNF subunit RnfB
MKTRLTRRDLFSMFVRPLQTQGKERAPDTATQAQIAVIQGRHCLALTSFCAACFERCPVPGAIERNQGMPMVVPSACTGCGICQQVCPAPINAVLLLPRRNRVPVPKELIS